MVKTILNTVVVILVLAVVFFVALRWWEGRKPAPEVVESTPPPSVVTVRNISVSPTSEGALLQVSEVPGPGYTIHALDEAKGFVIDIPEATISMTQSSIPHPHPLIRSVDVSQIVAQGVSHARIRVELTGEATYRDRLQGSSLLLDVTSSQPSPTPTPEVTAAPTPKPRVSRATRKKATKRTTTASRPRRTTVATRAPTPRPEPREEPPTPGPALSSDDEQTLRALGIETAPTSGAPTPAPAVAEPAEAAPIATIKPPPSLDPMLGEQDLPPAARMDDMPPPEEPKVAAIPPPEMGKFEVSQITRNMPALTDLQVSNQAGVTAVRIKREKSTPFKFLRTRTDRGGCVVVEFKDTISRLKPSYGAFSGTKVTSVATKEFVAAEGTISRVSICMDGVPKYDHAVEGTDLVVRLP